MKVRAPQQSVRIKVSVEGDEPSVAEFPTTPGKTLEDFAFKVPVVTGFGPFQRTREIRVDIKFAPPVIALEGS